MRRIDAVDNIDRLFTVCLEIAVPKFLLHVKPIILTLKMAASGVTREHLDGFTGA